MSNSNDTTVGRSMSRRDFIHAMMFAPIVAGAMASLPAEAEAKTRTVKNGHFSYDSVGELKKKGTRVTTGSTKLVFPKGTSVVFFVAPKTKTYKIKASKAFCKKGSMASLSFTRRSKSGSWKSLGMTVRDRGRYVEPICGMYALKIAGRKVDYSGYLNFDAGVGRATSSMLGKIKMKKGDIFTISFESGYYNGSRYLRGGFTLKIS